MFRNLITLFVSVVFFSTSHAQLCYKVTNPSTGTISYLFGTNNGSGSYFAIPYRIFSWLDRVKTVYVETANLEATWRKAESLSKSYSAYPPGTSIRDHLTNKEYTELRDKFVQTGVITAENFDKHTALLTPYALLKVYIGMKEPPGSGPLDHQIEGRAKQIGIKDIRSLETLEQTTAVQAYYARKLSPSYFVRHIDSLVNENIKMDEAYIKMDTTVLRRFSAQDSMIAARNRSWMRTLGPQMKTRPCYVAVRAVHLFGNTGLISLLKQEGFFVEAIRVDWAAVTKFKKVHIEVKKNSDSASIPPLSPSTQSPTTPEVWRFGHSIAFLRGSYSVMDNNVSRIWDYIAEQNEDGLPVDKAMASILIGVKLNPELTKFSSAQVPSITKKYQSFVISDSSDAIAIALGINPETAKNYRYHVVENDSVELVPWTSDFQMQQNYGAKTPYAFLGKFNAPGKMIMIEVVNTKDYKIRDGVIFHWKSNYKPVVTELHMSTPTDDFNLLDTVTNRGYASKIDPQTGLPLVIKFPVDSLESLDVSLAPHPTVPYVARLTRNIDGVKDTVLLEWWFQEDFFYFERPDLIKKPGKYELIIQAGHIADDWNDDQILKIPFEIMPPPLLEKKVSFRQLLPYIGATVLTVALLFFVYRQNQKVKFAKASRQKEIVQLQLRSIRSQLNPHFMFNALSSIQNLMNKNDIPSANHYLRKFADLTRHVLHTGEKDLVSLEDELILLDDYLQMEQLRFQFSYSIKVDEQINKANTEIPSMLLQPFVENAVKHGVSALHEHGNIEINIEQQNKDLVLSVHDNGKGFDMETDQEKKSSFGIKLSEQRIKLLNEIYKDKPATLMIESNDSGSLVTIKLTNWF